MPKRPTSHQINTAAERALEIRVGDQIVLHPRGTNDYGVDFDAEYFDGENATGLMFEIQLKGTAKATKNPSTSIKWTTDNYWSAQDRPVLVVLWDQATGTFYWHWAHRIDHYGVDKTAHKTYTLKFPPTQVWNDDILDLLIDEVKAWRAWHNAPAHLPIPVVIHGVDEICGVNTGAVTAQARGILRGFPNYVKVRTEPTAGLHIDIEYHTGETVAWIAGGPRTVLHHHDYPAVPNDPTRHKTFAASYGGDLALLVSYQFGRLGLYHQAARIAGAAIETAHMALNHGPAYELIRMFCETDRVADALRLCARALGTDDHALIMGTQIALIDGSADVDADGRDRIVNQIVSWAELAITKDMIGRASSFLYNAAQVNNHRDWTRTIELHDRAADLDPGYRQRDYWWRERGGSLFLAGRFPEAIESYRTAVGLGSKEARPLLADALMFNGDYQEALDLLAEIIADDELTRSQWRLTQKALSAITSWTGITQQERRPAEAAALADPEQDTPDFVQALTLDLLCPDALFHLGDQAMADGNPALDLYLLAAVADPPEYVTWLRALTAAAVEDEDLGEDVALCAKYNVGDVLIERLLEHPTLAHVAAEIQAHFEEISEDEPNRKTVARVVTHGTSEVAVFERGL